MKSEPTFAAPTDEALRWVAESFGAGASVVAVRRLTGGITSAMHVISIVDSKGRHHRCVLRRWVGEHPDDGPQRVAHEARILIELGRTNVPAPRLLRVDPDGVDCGVPSILMSFVDGRVELTPKDPKDWLHQMVAMLVRIHNTAIDVPLAESWLNRENLEVPEWSRQPELWREAIDLIRESPPDSMPCFIHHDYQQFNLLWRRGKLTSVVDWVWGSTGSPDIDVAHARLNLSVLYSADVAAQFLELYESQSGRTVERWWDVEGLLHYLPGWGDFLQLQAGRRLKVDFAGMHQRVEETLDAALRRN